ncbi:yhgE/Pip domain-containing protein [Listeria grandensis FSL F6-0971]|uniref:YhgE/Pip domain-containing protein n=1 Tax=Listeria grandensis FSL F6-0971 TaxID=1265819 RepID=W7BD41_9LIST|nr:YhgE/Pip domain-containing protein [Listeria grandensis]EUJ22735.1 yhgE/Pip domain-containing protein [Listeria grandensis FSL F6-0971]
MNMLKQEWKRLLNNKILLIASIVILFIPILYGGVFLKSVWDPYGKTSQLPVAVVNQDQAADYEGQTLDVGNELVGELKKNNDLGWNFTDSKAAEQGLKDGKYYMVITIPKDFSKNASTVLDTTPKKMNLSYEINPAQNYIGEVVTGQGASAVNAKISKKVTESYAKAIFSQISKVGDGFQTAADGSKKLDDGTIQLKDGSKTLTSKLNELASSTPKLADGVTKLDNGAVKLNVGLEQYTTGASGLQSGLTKIESGTSQLAQNSPALVAGSNKLADGLNTLNGKTATLAAKVPELNNGQQQLNNGLKQLQVGSNKLNAGLKTLNNGLPSDDQVKQLSSGLTAMQSGIAQINSQLNNSADTNAMLTNITKQMTTMSTALKDLGATIQTNGKGTTTAITNTNAFKNLTSAEQKEMADALNTELTQQATKQAQIATQLGASLTSTATTLQEDLKPIAAQMGDLKTAINTLHTNAAKLLPATKTAVNGFSAIQTGTDRLLAGSNQLTAGITQLTTGSNQLAAGTSQLTNSIPALVGGVSQLADGSTDLNNGITTYTNGVGDVHNGISQASAGASKLAQNSPALLDGSSALANGTNQLAAQVPGLIDGTGKLAAGSTKLGTGLATLSDGTGELATKLKDGATEVGKIDPTSKTYDMIAQPTDLTEKKLSNVPNYGHGLAPYVLSLGLYVGALVFNFIFPIRRPSMTPTSGVSWWLSKFSIGFVAAVLQALILDFVMLALGLDVAHMGDFFLISILTSLTFMFLVMLLATAFGNPGRFVAMVILVLQLGASGGTFPMPLTDGFFNAINPYLPMTHTVYGFRQAISSGLGNHLFVVSAWILVGLIILFNALLILTLSIRKNKRFPVTTLQEQTV